MEAETGDGSIRARGRFDVMNLRTGDGGIEAEVSAGSKLSSSWEVNTGDGHVILRLPEGLAADLDAHTNDGRIDLELPLLTSKLGGSNDVRGKLNGGGLALKIRTGDGAIRIARL